MIRLWSKMISAHSNDHLTWWWFQWQHTHSIIQHTLRYAFTGWRAVYYTAQTAKELVLTPSDCFDIQLLCLFGVSKLFYSFPVLFCCVPFSDNEKPKFAFNEHHRFVQTTFKQPTNCNICHKLLKYIITFLKKIVCLFKVKTF